MKLLLAQIPQPKNTKDSSSSETCIHGRWLLLLRIIWLVVAFWGGVLVIASLPFSFVQLQTICTGSACSNLQLTPLQVQALQHLGLSVTFYAIAHITLLLLDIFVTYALAGIVMWRKSNESMALFFAFLFVTCEIYPLGGSDALLIKMYPVLLLPCQLIAFLNGTCLSFFFCLFPNGRFVPRWSRWVALVEAGSGVLQNFFPQSLAPGTLLFVINTVLSISFFPFIFVVQFYRCRWVSIPVERQQIKWNLFGLLQVTLVALIILLSPLIFPSLSQPGSLYSLVMPFVWRCAVLLSLILLSTAILRYRLWDIDILINRTLVYVGLSASVIGLYVLVVMSFGTLFQAQGNLLISLLATGVIAVLFQPLRERLQRGVNRLMFGERDEPYRVLARLGQRLETTLTPDALLPTIVETVAQALKLPFVAIAWTSEQTLSSSSLVAVYGETGEENLEHIPLVYQTETIGSLVLAPRQRGEQLTPADRRFLSTLASQIAVATHAMRLTVDLKEVNIDLQRSREQLVTTREEERRRLRRDLHDGLGPTLAALNLQVGTLRTLIAHNPVAADALVVEWRVHLRKVIADIRGLVYALRPPALDELGLLGTLRDQLPALPAAVEVAAYRIVQEALTNVARHAQAQTCHVRIEVADALHLDIRDDGTGLPQKYHAGVGLVSMKERAVELGGMCVIEPAESKGTRVRVELPLRKE